MFIAGGWPVKTETTLNVVDNSGSTFETIKSFQSKRHFGKTEPAANDEAPEIEFSIVEEVSPTTLKTQTETSFILISDTFEIRERSSKDGDRFRVRIHQTCRYKGMFRFIAPLIRNRIRQTFYTEAAELESILDKAASKTKRDKNP